VPLELNSFHLSTLIFIVKPIRVIGTRPGRLVL
jgi:hypothetical protein